MKRLMSRRTAARLPFHRRIVVDKALFHIFFELGKGRIRPVPLNPPTAITGSFAGQPVEAALCDAVVAAAHQYLSASF